MTGAELLGKLNEKQREAVVQTEGPVLILAGAGSGKTRALTFRVAYLIQEKKIRPKNILAVTFTNKAAGEMLFRVKELLNLPEETPPYSQYLPHVGTFHSTCARILRREIERLGYGRNFTIYDDQDQAAVMRRVMRELEIPTEELKPQAVLSAISNAKNKLIDAEQFVRSAGNYFEERVARCYEKYSAAMLAANAVDFDDLILLTVALFRQHSEILSGYQELFRYILVDEYQDTNHAQYILLKMLAEKYRNLCVVGDDWQSIYGWRGADVQNILDFEKDYSEAKVVMLEQNYRSTQNILDAAHGVISKNVNRKDKKLWTENDQGQPLTLYQAVDEIDEARFVAEEISAWQKDFGLKLNDFAVLYRTNAQSRALEEVFMKEGLPYRIIGGVKFYQRAEIKDMLAYLTFIVNSHDKVSFERIVNVPARGLGDKTVAKVLKEAEKHRGDVLLAMENLAGEKEAGDRLNPAKTRALKELATMVRKIRQFSLESSPAQTIGKIYQDSGYELMLKKQGDEGAVRAENVLELLTVANKYDNRSIVEIEEMREFDFPAEEKKAEEKTNPLIEAFLEEVALVSQADRDLATADSVPMLTLHSAKGLEYEVIFIVGMEEGLLPHSRAALSEREMEEERRLCYVGITRAKQKAHLLYTNARNIYGSTQIAIRSRFIDEIDGKLFEERYASEETFFVTEDETDSLNKRRPFGRGSRSSGDDLDSGHYSKRKRSTLGRMGAGKQDLCDGDRVSHPDFGEGIIVGQDEMSVSVVFPRIGLKKLAKGIAPLKRV